MEIPATEKTNRLNARAFQLTCALVFGCIFGFWIGLVSVTVSTAVDKKERILIASAIETGEMVRSALLVYATKSPENSFPGILELHNHETLQSIVNAHGGSLKELSESNVRFLFYEPYSWSVDEKPGVNYTYALSLAIKDVPAMRLYVSPLKAVIGKTQQ